MKILLTGANGQLGRELLRQSEAYPFEPVPTDLDELGICDGRRVENCFADMKPDLVINAAAYTRVDEAESEQESAFRVNSDGPRNLALNCSKKHIPLIHISTDYVFDGKKGRPYVEPDPVSPLGVYGKSKAAGEAGVRSLLPEHIILRTAWLYSEHGQNFVKTMLTLGREKKTLRIVADQFGCPTSARDLAHAVLHLATHIRNKSAVAWGTYHYCGKGIVSWFQFAEKIFELTGKLNWLPPPQLIPITTGQYETPAERPPYSVLDCSRIQKTFAIHPEPWQQSLALVLQRIMRNENTPKS